MPCHEVDRESSSISHRYSRVSCCLNINEPTGWFNFRVLVSPLSKREASHLRAVLHCRVDGRHTIVLFKACSSHLFSFLFPRASSFVYCRRAEGAPVLLTPFILTMSYDRDNSSRIYVGNLPMGVEQRDVEAEFSRFGRLLRCDIKRTVRSEI